MEGNLVSWSNWQNDCVGEIPLGVAEHAEYPTDILDDAALPAWGQHHAPSPPSGARNRSEAHTLTGNEDIDISELLPDNVSKRNPMLDAAGRDECWSPSSSRELSTR